MFENYQICPYTGLRSFTEEESLYFKGRDEHITEATQQLQENKFIMLTGASGDGKSSLVYAGIVPNARAGFLKSKYTNWCVADFRPERDPLSNLCKVLARELGIDNASTVESEVRHGFSALVDLYKNSKRFIDTESLEWKNADETGKATLKREAGNLLILVDQFEEFFTNPENYSKGVPSTESSLVLNVLLETARIALEEDLPIYIVFTMRSDYIGQCAAFRGLPEYIGFSQFFVPRLNRVQLQDVIEEPAKLSGNRITRRLTERLIHDLTEGVDQLPILQHALNQIWVAANNGQEEMDLVHYAMVGGMSKAELPEEQVSKFTSWFSDLPPQIQGCYHQPNLQNVLDTHANKMFEEAEEYYNNKTGKTISDSDAKLIIKTAFKCLTKIDQSRAVRNRMTLEEITNVLAVPELDVATVGSVLDIFREPGNTFVRPFINPDSENNSLKKTDVLDITHESLIRNWAYLESWAKEEFENYTIYLDYEQQLNRWVESDQSNDFLLSIGPLTYFENWYDQAKPNQWWVARYLPEDEDQKEKLKRANTIINNANAFLKGSARKHVVTRSIMKYGPKRIAAVLAIIGLITLSSFAVRNYLRQQNEFVLENVKRDALALTNKKNIGLEYTIPVLVELIKLGDLTLKEALVSIDDPVQRLHIGNGANGFLIYQGRYQPATEILESLSVMDSLLEVSEVPKDASKLPVYLKELNDFKVVAGFAHLYNPSPEIKSLVNQNAERSKNYVHHILQTQPEGFSAINTFCIALEDGINNQSFTNEELKNITAVLSPFENSTKSEWIQAQFQRDKLQVRGTQDYGFKFNGLYQELGYLYAAQGNVVNALKCIDTLLHYNQTYYQNDYSSMSDNASNIALVFYQSGFENELDQFVKGYSEKKGISPIEFYSRLLARILTDNGTSGYFNLYAFSGEIYSNLNLRFCTDEAIVFFNRKLRTEINEQSNPDERNFNLAVALKNEGIMLSHRKEMRGNEATDKENQLFKRQLMHTRKLDVGI
ncbi:MAG: hypothetical protein HC811_10920 [Flammeovirgaceae bacterium]|nr:hypothetical protein [Flammeovirgaceae bacterium]